LSCVFSLPAPGPHCCDVRLSTGYAGGRTSAAPGANETTPRRNDCEDRQHSLMVLGCGLVTTSVTPGMTGLGALLRPVRSWSLAPAR